LAFLAPHHTGRAVRRWLLTLVLGLSGALTGSGPARADAASGLVEIAIHGQSTLHGFDGIVEPLPLVLEEAGDGSFGASITVPVTAIDTGIERRNANMREMLDAAHFPSIVARFSGLDRAAVEETGRISFVLRIRGVERPVTALVRDWKRDGNQLDFDAGFDVSLRDFGLQAPSVLFVKVADLVGVRVHVTLASDTTGDTPR